MTMTIPTQKAKNAGTPVLLFNKYGDTYFLSKVSGEDRVGNCTSRMRKRRWSRECLLPSLSSSSSPCIRSSVREPIPNLNKPIHCPRDRHPRTAS